MRGITQPDGTAEFCEVFFTDARCPADNVVGGVNNGWKVANTTLGFERGQSATTGYRRFEKEYRSAIRSACWTPCVLLILAVMALSGALAGIGGASQDGDFRHQLDPRGLPQAGYGYAGIVDRGARPLQPVRGRASWRSCSAGCRTRATRCRASTSRPASSA